MDRARSLYREDFGKESRPGSLHGGRDRGDNVVGDKPAKSPGDTSDLPPSGEELLETADEDKPRVERFRNKFYRELDDVTDSAKDQAQSVQDLLESRPPAGHAEVQVPTGPSIGPETQQHATVDAGSATEMCMLLGVVGFQFGRWVHHKVDELRGR